VRLKLHRACETGAVRVLSIVHEHEAGSGVFADAARERGDEVVEWIPAEGPAPALESFGAVLVFGGATHVDQEPDFDWLRAEKELLGELLTRGAPLLGVCLGAQLVAEVAGGAAHRMPVPEIGWSEVELTPQAASDAVLGQLPTRFAVFQWHSYEMRAPSDAVALAHSPACLQAFRLRAAPWWAIQFHAEVTEETIAAWIDDYRSDPDAVRADLDWAAMLTRTRSEIAGWNELGVGMCRRFLDVAASAADAA
jgi:GMP synthase-like glutamine amidotransferase